MSRWNSLVFLQCYNIRDYNYGFKAASDLKLDCKKKQYNKKTQKIGNKSSHKKKKTKNKRKGRKEGIEAVIELNTL